MKQIMSIFLIFMLGLTSITYSQTRVIRRQNSTRNNGFTFSQDAEERIKIGCPKVLKIAQQFSRDMRSKGTSDIHSELTYMCLVNEIELEQSPLGPWEKFVNALEKVFKQFRRLLYVAAVFMMLWILVKAIYEDDMKWTHIGMMVIGITMLAFAEVFLDIATNRVTLDDIKNSELYVDCREPNKALYRCTVDSKGAMDKESVYLFEVNQKNTQNQVLKGLY